MVRFSYCNDPALVTSRMFSMYIGDVSYHLWWDKRIRIARVTIDDDR